MNRITLYNFILFRFSTDLLIAGDMIELSEVVEMATSFLVDQLDPSNAIGIYRYISKDKKEIHKSITLNNVEVNLIIYRCH